MIHIIKRNDDPPLTDDKMETLMGDIYERFEKFLADAEAGTSSDSNEVEEFSVWIADKIQAAYSDGYNQGCADSDEAYGYNTP